MPTYSCRQRGDEDWTETCWDNYQPEGKLAEQFCNDFVLDGEPPYLVDVLNHLQDEITTWKVEKVIMPVYQASPFTE